METQSTGMQLLQKGQKGVLKMIFSRMGLTLVLLVFNIFLLLAAFQWFEDFLPYVYGGTALFTVGMVIFIINSPMNPTAKITWLVVIMLLPVFGSLFYLFTCREFGHRALQKRLRKIYAMSPKNALPEDALPDLVSQDPGAGAMARYVTGVTGIPVCGNTRATYFPSGEAMLERMLIELQNAQKSIYLEYFIIDEGIMWGRILEILAQKAARGVDVRVMYDGSCEFMLLPKGYDKRLQRLGIACRVFSPVTPFVSTHYNYRDHRKILTVDGRVAFTGGVNLADEYINEKKLFGHWKDTAIMLQGEAAASFQQMFLQLWNLDKQTLSFPESSPTFAESDGFVMPYFDDPLDREQPARQVYIDILNRAQRYVHIMTPYLILDGELESALTYAAKRGVEVRLILPGIPDKKLPYALAKNHYPALVAAGVQIYEYTPGFVHAKVVVADDREAVAGTVNLDYRSLYHHFECAVYLHGASCIADIVRDFDETLSKCVRVTPERIRKEKLFYKLAGPILKAIATLM